MAVAFLLISFFAQGQQRCGTVEYLQKKRAQNRVLEQDAQFEQWLAQKIQQRQKNKKGNRIQSTYQIPVVVHVIHNGEDIGVGTNISNAQINSQIAVLNKDYNRLNADASSTPAEFLPVAGSMSVEFVLARRTPEGLPTNGIVRQRGTRTTWSYSNDEELKSLSYWPAEDYLNIWVCNLTGYLGYSQFPVSNLPGLEDSPDNRLTDGAVFSYRVFGSIDDGAFNLHPQYNKGRTATHELGHFFGLRHIWGDESSCAGTDYVADTPNQASETYNCPSHPRTDACTTGIMFQNYLDYTDDACMNIFTKGQIDRMIEVLENSPRRASLLVSPGLSDPDPTGTNLALVEVLSPAPLVCERSITTVVRVQNIGTTLISSFSVSVSINGVPKGTSQVTGLNLPSGDDVVVELPELAITDNENEITIEVVEPNGIADIDDQNNIKTFTFKVNDNEDMIPLKEDFEQPLNNRWSIVNPNNGMPWEEIDLESTSALYINAYDNTDIGDEAWFVSPILDLSAETEGRMFFDLSYASREGYYDQLTIVASLDCGPFDHILEVYSGPDISARTSPYSWLPTSDDWETFSTSLSSVVGNSDVRIAFVFTNGNGNNLYLDNIEFFVSDNPYPVKPEEDFFVFYPNYPLLYEVGVTLNLPEREYAKIELIDMMGRVLKTEPVPNALNQTLTFDLSTLPPAIYVMRIYTPQKSWIAKVTTD